MLIESANQFSVEELCRTLYSLTYFFRSHIDHETYGKTLRSISWSTFILKVAQSRFLTYSSTCKLLSVTMYLSPFAECNSPSKSSPTPQKIGVAQISRVLSNVYGSGSVSQCQDSIPLQQKLVVCSLLLMVKLGKMKEVTMGKVSHVTRFSMYGSGSPCQDSIPLQQKLVVCSLLPMVKLGKMKEVTMGKVSHVNASRLVMWHASRLVMWHASRLVMWHASVCAVPHGAVEVAGWTVDWEIRVHFVAYPHRVWAFWWQGG